MQTALDQPENLGVWGCGNLEIQTSEIQKNKKYKFSKSESILPKMSARSGLVGKNPRGPIWGPSQTIFSMDRTNPKKWGEKQHVIFLGGLMGPIHPVLALAAIHPRWGNR